MEQQKVLTAQFRGVQPDPVSTLTPSIVLIGQNFSDGERPATERVKVTGKVTVHSWFPAMVMNRSILPWGSVNNLSSESLQNACQAHAHQPSQKISAVDVERRAKEKRGRDAAL